MDNNEYTVVFNKRSDLRLWQKIKVAGYAEIPEEWMRIVHINYEYEAARVVVTCTLKNSAYVLAAAKMKRTAKYSDVNTLETMVQKILDKNLKIQGVEALTTSGENITVRLENGEVVIETRSPTTL
jgi:hypothetical protein